MKTAEMLHLVMWFSLQYLLALSDVTKGFKMRKICKDSIEILSSQGVHIEPFYKSHVRLSLVMPVELSTTSVRQEAVTFQLSFEFKTTSPDGILFYSRSSRPRELIALLLYGGDLFYKIQCPNLHADILLLTRNNSRLNDGEWHRISYSVAQHPYIEIDGFSSAKRYLVSCEAITSLIVGGINPEDTGHVSELERFAGRFEGCIRNVNVPVPLRTPPKYYAVSVCD